VYCQILPYVKPGNFKEGAQYRTQTFPGFHRKHIKRRAEQYLG
jgi:hypothetical protein